LNGHPVPYLQLQRAKGPTIELVDLNAGAHWTSPTDDLTRDFFIDAGSYTLQLAGFAPPSNEVTLTVEPGPPTARYSFKKQIQQLPEAANGFALEEGEVNPRGRDAVEGICLNTSGGLQVCQTSNPAAFVKPFDPDNPLPDEEDETGKPPPPVRSVTPSTSTVSTYLGKNAWGYVYAFPGPGELSAWEKIKLDIVHTLDVAPQRRWMFWRPENKLE
jgi:hypothetical protein